MAVTTNKGAPLGAVVTVPEPAAVALRRAVILEQAGDGWKAVEAEIGGDAITILGAHAVSAADGPPAPVHARNGSDVALLPELKTCVCRLLDLPGMAADQMEKSVALRLELELPYPVAESTWACEPQMNGHGASGQVLLIAAATREIALAEQTLQSWGIRDAGVEFAPASLAELALAEDDSTGTLAVLHVDRGAAMLVLAHGRSLCYARQIRLPESNGSGSAEWTVSLARDVNQSLYDYQLRSGNPRPDRLTIVGRGDTPALRSALEAQLEVPATPLWLPVVFSIASQEIASDVLVSDYPVCLGALLAMHRRLQGERSAAPPLQKQRRVAHAEGWRGRRGLLLALNAAALVLVLALGAVVHAVRHNADEKLIESSRPIRGSLEKLQEEVDILKFEDKRSRPMLDILAAMAEALPPDIKVESLSVDPKGKVTLTGKTGSVEAASDTAMVALRASKLFMNPQFHGATKEQDGFGFRITCDLRGGAAK